MEGAMLQTVSRRRVRPVIAYERAHTFFEEGVVAEKKNRLKTAETLYRNAIKEYPKLACAWLYLGSLLFDREDFEEAEKCYREALTIDPAYAGALYNLGNCCHERKEYEEALDYYERTIKANSTHRSAYFNAAVLHQKKYNNQKALEYWRIYYKLSVDMEHDRYMDHAIRCIKILEHRIRRLSYR